MEPQHGESQSNGPGMKWVVRAIVIAMVIAGGVGTAYISRQKTQLRDLTTANQTLNTSLTELRDQIKTMASKLDEQAAAARVESARAASAASIRQRSASGAPTRVTGNRQADPRFNQIQSRLEEQQKEISSSRDELNKTRDDLQGKLDTTRDELSGSISSTKEELSTSIARTHDDVVALQKRGDRNYYEFTLTKSKEFRRVGPLSLSVRKVNTKRKSYDLAMFVDDNQLQKKGVNLFEPVWIDLQDQSQPVQLVVNHISKDQIQGYIAAPKYKRSELGETASTAQQPSSATVPSLKQ
jgi:outer membrane murein-binding lipoprotein Lpp